MMDRLRALADSYFTMRVEQLGRKSISMLEVRKANNMELYSGNTIAFEVEAGMGIHIVPAGRARV